MIININIKGVWVCPEGLAEAVMGLAFGVESCICWYGQRWSSQVLVLLGRCCRAPYEDISLVLGGVCARCF